MDFKNNIFQTVLLTSVHVGVLLADSLRGNEK